VIQISNNRTAIEKAFYEFYLEEDHKCKDDQLYNIVVKVVLNSLSKLLLVAQLNGGRGADLFEPVPEACPNLIGLFGMDGDVFSFYR